MAANGDVTGDRCLGSFVCLRMTRKKVDRGGSEGRKKGDGEGNEWRKKGI